VRRGEREQKRALAFGRHEAVGLVERLELLMGLDFLLALVGREQALSEARSAEQ
jgi:hypothetical protein